MKNWLSRVFGRVTWEAPEWWNQAAQWVSQHYQRHPKRLGSLALVVAAVGLAHPIEHGAQKLKIVWLEYKMAHAALKAHVSSIQSVDLKITAPDPTDIENAGKPNPIAFEFSHAVVEVGAVGKEVKGVTISPAVAGKWAWSDTKNLSFKPEKEWEIGQTYSVEFDREALLPSVKLQDYQRNVTVVPLGVAIKAAQFYQDPIEVTKRKALFDVQFTHPINMLEFEKRVRLSYAEQEGAQWRAGAQRLPFRVTYDKWKLKATVESEPLPIPKESRRVLLSIASGVMAQRGGKPDTTEHQQFVTVPGLYGLTVEKVEATVVMKGDEPERVLQLQFGMPVDERQALSSIRAWILPSKLTSDTDQTAAKTWDNPEDVTESLLKKAKPIELTVIPQEKESNTLHSFHFKAGAPSTLFIQLKKGLVSAGGYQLGEDVRRLVQVEPFKPLLSIVGDGALLPLHGDKKLSVLVRDLPGIRLEMARLLPNQLHLLATQTQGTFAKPDFQGGLSPDDLTERFEKLLPLGRSPGKNHYETVDFSEYLKTPSGERRGIFLLNVQGYDPHSSASPGIASGQAQSSHEGEEGAEGNAESPAEHPEEFKDQRLILVTDLGCLIKQSVDGQRDVFVQSIASGQPVAEAIVEVWGKNGKVLLSYKTDADGRASLPNLSGYEREKKAVLVVVKKEEDLSFIPLDRADRQLDLSRFDVGGIQSTAVPNQLQAYLFSDRGVYRPGDTIHIGVMAKSKDWAQPLKGLPVEMEVMDARGLMVKREVLKLGDSGMSEYSYTPLETAPTGHYTFNLNVVRADTAKRSASRDTQTLGTVTVKVQEFMPDRMKMRAHLSSETLEGWVSPVQLKARVWVNNLFGTAAPHRRVESTLTLLPAYPSFKSYPDYHFFDPQRAKERHEEKLATVQTNEKGEAEIDLGLQRFESATFQLHLLTQAFEPEGGRGVAAEAYSLVSDLPYLVGFKSDGELDYIDRGAVRHVSLIAINPNAKKIAVDQLKLVRVENKVLSVLVKQSNGLYKYESKTKEVVLQEQSLSLTEKGLEKRLVTDQPGDFAYVVKNQHGLELNRIRYRVAGAANLTRSLDRHAELQMNLNKKDVEPGETLELSIRAPYVGAGLITIERDKVYAQQWFKTDKTASVQKITVPKNFEGNGYVVVQFVRDMASDEVYMSPLSYGAVPFATSVAKRTAPIRLSAPSQIKPGQVLTMRLESKTPTRAVVFAVDEGILQVAGYKNPNPLEFFFQKRALEVSTMQTLDLILPEFKKLMQMAAPGGDADALRGKHLNPFKRKHDKPVVYWSGIVDVKGGKSFQYTVPESFNGSLRVLAVTVNDSTMGVSAASTVVRGDLILLPTIPVALTPGDEVNIGVGVANNIKGSGQSVPITVQMSTSSALEVLGETRQSLNVSEQGEGSLHFRLRAKQGKQAQLGAANVVLTASHGSSQARLSTEVSIRPASSFVTLVQSGRIQGDGHLSSQSVFYDAFQKNSLSVSASPWGLVTGLIDYLEAYPHGCTEQIVSQTFPNVLLSQHPEIAKAIQVGRGARAMAKSVPNPQVMLEQTLALLRSRQTPEGGFGLYSNDSVHPFATVYAAQLLVEAKEHGLTVPEDMQASLRSYLQQYAANGDVSTLPEWRNHAYATYVLTRQGLMTTPLLAQLLSTMQEQATQAKTSDWRLDTGALYLAASYQLLKQEHLAQSLWSPIKKAWLASLKDSWKANVSDEEGDVYEDALTRHATRLALMVKHFPLTLREMPIQSLDRMAEALSDGAYHSLSSARLLLAVDAYSTALSQSAQSGVSVSVLDRKGQTQAIPFGVPNPLMVRTLPFGVSKVNLHYAGALPLYYSFSEAGYQSELPSTARSHGLDIARDFLDANDKVVAEAKVGDELTVRIRIRSTEKAKVVQVAVVDVLPGGIEPMLSQTAPKMGVDASDSNDEHIPLWRKHIKGDGVQHLQYVDIREDRLLFYGDVDQQDRVLRYKVRATNAGRFVVPAVMAEAMYDRKVFGVSAAGRLEVK
jgi:alpha-2-macroglobulin